MDVEAQRRRLLHVVQGLSVVRVSREVVILSRLLYRNKSQHRRELAYQKLVRVGDIIYIHVLKLCMTKLQTNWAGGK